MSQCTCAHERPVAGLPASRLSAGVTVEEAKKQPRDQA